jgi:hypothetical protein
LAVAPFVFALAALVLLQLIVAGVNRGTFAASRTGPPAATVPAAIAGTVRGSQGGAPISGREVEIIEVQTGRRHQASTNAAGAYRFLLPPGSYKVQVALEVGEAVASQPGVISVEAGQVEAEADFVVAARSEIKKMPQHPFA